MKLPVMMSVLALSALGMTGCGSKPPKPVEAPTSEVPSGPEEPAEQEPAAPKSLYDRLGGQDGIAAVVDSLIENVSSDSELKKVFAKTTGQRLADLKKNLADQLCEVTGGPCTYKGKDMKAAHASLKVTDAQWDKFILMLTGALNSAKVDDAEQSELLALLAPMKEQIVVAKKKK